MAKNNGITCLQLSWSERHQKLWQSLLYVVSQENVPIHFTLPFFPGMYGLVTAVINLPNMITSSPCFFLFFYHFFLLQNSKIYPYHPDQKWYILQFWRRTKYWWFWHSLYSWTKIAFNGPDTEWFKFSFAFNGVNIWNDI